MYVFYWSLHKCYALSYVKIINRIEGVMFDDDDSKKA